MVHTALLLAIFFGVFGAHRFCVGKTGTAVLLILRDLTMVGFAVSGIWAVIDCLYIAVGEFTDADGFKPIEWT